MTTSFFALALLLVLLLHPPATSSYCAPGTAPPPHALDPDPSQCFSLSPSDALQYALAHSRDDATLTLLDGIPYTASTSSTISFKIESQTLSLSGHPSTTTLPTLFPSSPTSTTLAISNATVQLTNLNITGSSPLEITLNSVVTLTNIYLNSPLHITKSTLTLTATTLPEIYKDDYSSLLFDLLCPAGQSSPATSTTPVSINSTPTIPPSNLLKNVTNPPKSSSCTTCPANTYAQVGESCTFCPTGSTITAPYSPDHSSISHCTPCPIGTR